MANPAWVCFSWFGMTAGVGLLATIARFDAPSATRAVALDIGRYTFNYLSRVELVALVLLLLVVRVSGRSRHWWAICATLVLIVMAQAVWLLPELGARTDMILTGMEPPPSALHRVYSALEIAKLVLLFGAGLYALSERNTKIPT